MLRPFLSPSMPFGNLLRWSTTTQNIEAANVYLLQTKAAILLAEVLYHCWCFPRRRQSPPASSPRGMERRLPKYVIPRPTTTPYNGLWALLLLVGATSSAAPLWSTLSVQISQHKAQQLIWKSMPATRHRWQFHQPYRLQLLQLLQHLRYAVVNDSLNSLWMVACLPSV